MENKSKIIKKIEEEFAKLPKATYINPEDRDKKKKSRKSEIKKEE